MRTFALSLTLLAFSVPGLSHAAEEEKATGSDASTWFTLEIGDAWTLVDSTGSVTIKVLEEREVGGEAAFKVGWFADDSDTPYQGEIWRKKGGEYFVLGRVFGEREIMFEAPYVFLKETMKSGDAWDAVLKVMGREIKLSFTVGEKETVKTEAGTFEAFKVSINGPGQSIDRWYSPAVGMVKEIGRISLGGKTSPGNEKLLQKHVEGAK